MTFESSSNHTPFTFYSHSTTSHPPPRRLRSASSPSFVTLFKIEIRLFSHLRALFSSLGFSSKLSKLSKLYLFSPWWCGAVVRYGGGVLVLSVRAVVQIFLCPSSTRFTTFTVCICWCLVVFHVVCLLVFAGVSEDDNRSGQNGCRISVWLETDVADLSTDVAHPFQGQTDMGNPFWFSSEHVEHVIVVEERVLVERILEERVMRKVKRRHVTPIQDDHIAEDRAFEEQAYEAYEGHVHEEAFEAPKDNDDEEEHVDIQEDVGGFPGSPRDASLLTHSVKHVAYAISQGRDRGDMLKLISHGKKVNKLGPCAEGIQDIVSFHLPVRETTITLDDVSTLLHLPVLGQLCDLEELEFEEACTALVDLLSVDGGTAGAEMEDASGTKVRLSWLKDIYVQRYAWGVAANLYEQLGDAKIRSKLDGLTYSGVVWHPYEGHRGIRSLFGVCMYSGWIRIGSLGFTRRLPTVVADADVVAVDFAWLHFTDHVIRNVRQASYPSKCVDGYIQWFRRVSHSYIIDAPTDARPALAPTQRPDVTQEARPHRRSSPPSPSGTLARFRRMARKLQSLILCRHVTEGTDANDGIDEYSPTRRGQRHNLFVLLATLVPITTGKSVITEGYLPAAFRPSVKCWPSVISAMGYKLEIWVSFPQIPQFQNSLVSPISKIPLFPSLPNLITLSHCHVANAEAGSLMAITLWFVWLGDSWKLEFALEVVAVSRFDFGGVEANGGSLLGGALPFPTLCSKQFVGLEHEVAAPRQFEVVVVSDADDGSLVAGLRLGFVFWSCECCNMGRGCWVLACRGRCGEMVLADAECLIATAKGRDKFLKLFLRSLKLIKNQMEDNNLVYKRHPADLAEVIGVDSLLHDAA
ncbi:hypothetical protein V8G54_020109 [Vigna mungo]|uniref:Aminotransferase-like plant mobile domain-containing protein n=1 Tax=Vigna mungo TaxID=3915 RepID=A0AAQ3NDQ1_VIGMU